MSLNVSGTRVSNSLLAQVAIRNINQNMQQMLELQYQMASGLRLYKPSVDPASAAVTLSFQHILERREQSVANISRSNEFLSSTDTALSDLQDLLNEAVDIASTNIGAGADDTSRQNAATVAGSLISQLAQIGNRQYNGRYLFAGRATDEAPFDLTSTRVQFVGDTGALYTITDRTSSTQYNVTAEEAFGTLTGRVTSLDDLDPAITLATRLSELNAGDGVRRGTITASDGTDTTQIDLSGCDTIGDVIDVINANGVVNITAGINVAGNGLLLQAGPADTISIDDVPGGYAARDLGILQATPLPAGTDLVGGDLDRLLTDTTEMSALCGGLGIDQASGLIVQIGSDSVTLDLSGAVTVQDMLNEFRYCGLSLQAGIDTAGQRVWVANTVASQDMMVGENSGTTATDLGIRSMPASMLLEDLNGGQGVRLTEGVTDFNIVCSDGSIIDMDLTGLSTVQDVLDTINGHAANGGRVVADLNVVGNGIRLTDTTGGAGDFQVARTNSSFAAVDLGIDQIVPNPGAVINGDDMAPVVEQGVFQHLFALRDALLSNDSVGISRAGSALQDDIDRAARVRGSVGTRMQSLENSSTRIEDECVQIQGLLSEARDLDYAAAVSRFETLQATFQASLQTAAGTLPMSLLDFLS